MLVDDDRKSTNMPFQFSKHGVEPRWVKHKDVRLKQTLKGVSSC